MSDPKIILIFLRSVLDRIVKFDYKKLLLKRKVDRYDYAAWGVEMTWPWRREEGGWVKGYGLGLGFGLRKRDVWFGWPRADKWVDPLAPARAPQDQVLVG